MATNQERLRMVQAKKQALIQIEKKYKDSMPKLVDNIVSDKPDRDGIAERFHAFNRPYLEAAMLVSQQFYKMRREQQVKPLPELKLNDSKVEERKELVRSGATLQNKAYYFAAHVVKSNYSPAQTLSTLDSLSSQVVFNGERELTQEYTEQDPQAKDVRRVARADGCDFCKMMAEEFPNASDFHDGCRCIFDTDFENEDPLQQAYAEEYRAEIDEAKESIANGTAGEKVAHVGTDEWRGHKYNELRNAAPDLDRTTRRKILGEASIKNLSSDSVKALENAGLDPKEFASAAKIKVTNATPNNITWVLQQRRA